MTLTRRGKYWHYAFQMDGGRYRGSTKETVKARAAQYEQLKMAEAREGGGRVIRKRAPILSDWAKLFLAHCDEQVAANQLAKKSAAYYHDGWKLLAKTAVASMRIDRIEKEHWTVLVFPGSPSYANCALRTLRRMLHAAVKRKRMIVAPKIRCVEEAGRQQLIDASREESLLRHAKEPLRTIILIHLDTGMRPEEIMRMRRSHIFWDLKTIAVTKAKTSRGKVKPRFVPLTDRVAAALSDHKDGADGWLFPSSRAKSGHRPRISHQWRDCRKAVNEEAAREGLPPLPKELVLYCGRHTFGTDLYAESKNLKLVQEALGHSDLKTTMRYLHADSSDILEMVNARNRRREIALVKKTG